MKFSLCLSFECLLSSFLIWGLLQTSEVHQYDNIFVQTNFYSYFMFSIFAIAECPFKKSYSGKPISDPEVTILTNETLSTKPNPDIVEKSTDQMGSTLFCLFAMIVFSYPLSYYLFFLSTYYSISYLCSISYGHVLSHFLSTMFFWHILLFLIREK